MLILLHSNYAWLLVKSLIILNWALEMSTPVKESDGNGGDVSYRIAKIEMAMNFQESRNRR